MKMMNKSNYTIEDTNQVFQEENNSLKELDNILKDCKQKIKKYISKISKRIDQLEKENQSIEDKYEFFEKYEKELLQIRKNKLGDACIDMQDIIDVVQEKVSDKIYKLDKLKKENEK